MTTHKINAHTPRTFEPGDDTTGDAFTLAGGTYAISAHAQRGWRGGTATLMFNGSPLAGFPVLTSDWAANSFALSAGTYQWQLAGNVQGFVGKIDG